MPDLTPTRRSLHAVAELLLAGPQHADHGTIKLTVTDDGFATVREPVAAVAGVRLHGPSGSGDLDGATIADLGKQVGLVPRDLTAVYTDGCGLDASHVLRVDAGAAAQIHAGFARGDRALADFAPDAERVLWPEHFDLGITIDEVNYGISPGDSFLDVPYAYVGPWSLDGLQGDFWNAPFGAALPLDEIDDVHLFFARAAVLVRP